MFERSRDGEKGKRDAHHDKMRNQYGVGGPPEGYSQKKAYVCCMLGMCCLCGCHRCYLDKTCTGCIWCFTLGGLGILQIYDCLTMKHLISAANCEGGGEWDGGYKK